VVDADLQRFFDTIPHEHIMQGVSERISDGRILELVGLLLRQGVMDGWTWDPSDEGTPQGSVVSPLLANIALHGLDQLAESQGCALVRYADDFVAICGTQEQAEAALSAFSGWCAGHGLWLHPDKTRIVAYGAGESFDFLGFTFKQGKYFPRKKSFQNLRNKVRSHTPRNSGRSLSQMLNDLNPMLRGWYGYFKVCSPAQLAQGDQFVRRRLRCILSRRLGKRGMRSLSSNCRWSIAYFASQGLFSMEEARRTALSEVNH
jgi:RNA-directed DNA polymerase